MSLDVNKIITESINEAAGFNDIYKQAIDDMASGKAAEIVYDKIHPEKEAGEHFTLKPEEMDLPKTGALAAAVAAGLGALALRKKLKNMK